MTEATALTDQLAITFRSFAELDPGVELCRDSRLERTILETYAHLIKPATALSRIYQLFVNEKPELAEWFGVRTRRHSDLFRQPIVLLVYLLSWDWPFIVKYRWPYLSPMSLRPIYADLGMDYDSF
jgi:hypothetical protein